MKTLFQTFLVVAVASVASVTGDAADRLPPPVSATFVSKHEGKPPMKFIRAALVLTNRTKTPLWFVLPYNCDQPPGLNKPVRIPEGFEPTWIPADGFNTGEYYKAESGSKGKVIRITVLNVTDDKGFRLFRLPPGGRVEFESYEFQMWSDYVRSFKVWTADEIKVNGKETLENWLPYQTLSDARTFVPAKTQADNLNWDTKTSANRTDFRKEPVSQLDLKITGTWEIPLENFK